MNAWLESKLKEIERDYNPENDIATPEVSHTEWVLLQAIKALQEQIDELQTASELAESVAISGAG